MFQVGRIKIRDIKELQHNDVVTPQNAFTPLRKRKNLKSATTSKKHLKEETRDSEAVNFSNTTSTITKTATKRLQKSALKETPSNQKFIDSYFTSCPKTYEINVPKEETLFVKSKTHKTKAKGNGNTNTNKKKRQSAGRPKTRRKRLFADLTEPSTENMSDTSFLNGHKNENDVECIIIDSDSDEENDVKKEVVSSANKKAVETDVSGPVSNSNENQILPTIGCEMPSISSLPIAASSLSFGLQLSKTSCEIGKSAESSSASGSGRRKTKPCPPYKIIENTTFAVDAFQFGYIHNVTHYFLTHFHADHYIGLTKSFSMPLFVSPITARLLRAFIPVQEQYIHELELNQPVVVNNIEITALDANHCPGSIMFVFKFLGTGKCVLHTGDFRAWYNMESEPIFWNNAIHTIYLDTTYISEKYAFCTQYESIEKARSLINNFLVKHCWQRVLYVCGAYIIGKERFWASLAEDFVMKVWAEGNRSKALKAINDERFNRLLVEDPNEANMHILPMGKLTYLELVEYFKLYEHKYDLLFALRPSGWEKDNKPRYGSKINLVGIEYSEHSSYAEMQRFVKFLKPEQVISTVPRDKNLMQTSSVPQNWYKYDKLKVTSNYQPSIDSYLAKTAQRKPIVRPPNANKGGVEHFVSPFKLNTPKKNMELNNSPQANVPCSINSSFQPAQTNVNVEVVGRDQSPTNVKNNKNPAKNKLNTLAKSIANSSEDFEKSDFIVKTKNFQSNEKDFKVKEQNKSLTETKQKRSPKKSAPKNISAQDNKIHFEELLQRPDMKLETSQMHACFDKGLNHLRISPTQKRITRSQSSATKITNNSPKTTARPYGEFFDSTSPKKTETKSINSTTNSETIPFELEFPISQKRVTRANSSKTIVLPSCKINSEHEFETKLLKITEHNNAQKISNPRKCTTNFNKYPENPIFKSTTDSSVDRLSDDDMHFNKINSSANCENFLEDFAKLPTNSSKNKRRAPSRNSTPFKRAKPTFNTQTILNTILEQSENIDRFSCSQLAGLVVETVNQQNPDNNNDHIPADLLSDADDDWI